MTNARIGLVYGGVNLGSRELRKVRGITGLRARENIRSVFLRFMVLGEGPFNDVADSYPR